MGDIFSQVPKWKVKIPHYAIVRFSTTIIYHNILPDYLLYEDLSWNFVYFLFKEINLQGASYTFHFILETPFELYAILNAVDSAFILCHLTGSILCNQSPIYCICSWSTILDRNGRTKYLTLLSELTLRSLDSFR